MKKRECERERERKKERERKEEREVGWGGKYVYISTREI